MYSLSQELTVILINICWLQKFRERLAVNKQAAKTLDAERFNLRKLSDLEVKKEYQIYIS